MLPEANYGYSDDRCAISAWVNKIFIPAQSHCILSRTNVSSCNNNNTKFTTSVIGHCHIIYRKHPEATSFKPGCKQRKASAEAALCEGSKLEGVNHSLQCIASAYCMIGTGGYGRQGRITGTAYIQYVLSRFSEALLKLP